MRLSAIGAVFFALAFTACNSVSPIPRSGDYQGSVIRLNEGILQKLPIQAVASDVSGGKATIQLSRADGTRDELITLSDVSSSSLKLLIPSLGTQPIELKADQSCLIGTGDLRIRLCPARDEIVIEAARTSSGAGIYSLSLDWFPIFKPMRLEPAKSYGLDEAVANAFRMSFDDRIEFQRVMQAKHRTANSYLNLIPHLTINSILGLTQYTNVQGLLGIVGDLVPFLLPSRWFRAKADSLDAEAEQDGLILMRADAAEQILGLAYLFDRDKRIETDYEGAIQEAEQAHGQVQTDEFLGEFPPGTADNLKTTIDGMKLDLAVLELTINEEKTSLAQSMGLMNPDGVTDLSMPQDDSKIAQAQSIDGKSILALALDRSFELRQLDFLIQAAQEVKTADYFDWMDPTGDPSLGLGAGLGEAVAVQSSKINELEIDREQLQSQVYQEVTDVTAEHNEALKAYRLASDDLTTQERRFNRTQELLNFGKDVSVLDLVTVYQDRLKAKINVLNSIAAFEISRAKLDRLELEGYFSQLSSAPLPIGPNGPTPQGNGS